MNCQNCHQPLEAGAAFCGNCGQPVGTPAAPAQTAAVSGQAPAAGSPIPQVLQSQAAAPQPPTGPLVAAGAGGVPSYALALPGQHHGDIQALLSLLLGIAGIVGALFLPLLGLGLSVAGIAMGTMSRSSSKRRLSTAGLIVSSLAVLASLGLWAYAANRSQKLQQTGSSNNDHSITAPAVSTAGLSTPCYSISFVNKLNVANNNNSCDMDAYNGATLNTSTEVYKIYADTSQVANSGNFAAIAKSAIEKDIQTNLPGFTIDSEQSTQFAGSPAYVANASQHAQHFAVVEAAVFHQVAAGQNVFVLVHAVNGDNTDLNILEAQWQWK